jgi:hypothetical protein
MVLQDRLKGIKMLDSELVTSFLGIFTHIRDELAAVREIDELYQTMGSICSRHYFQKDHAHLGETLG